MLKRIIAAAVILSLFAFPSFAENSYRSKAALTVTACKVNGDPALGRLTAVLTVTNESRLKDARSIRLTVACPEGTVPEKTDSLYIEKLGAGKSQDVVLTLLPTSGYTGGACRGSVSAEYSSEDGEELSAAIGVTFVLPALKKAEPPTKNASQPRLMLEAFEVDGGFVVPGEKRGVKLRIVNSSRSKGVENIKLTICDESGAIRADGTGEAYFDRLGAGETLSLETSLTALPSAASGEHTVKLKLEYEDAYKSPFTEEKSLPVTVRQPAELVCSGLKLPAKLTAGEAASVQIGLMNAGKSSVLKCVVTLEADGLETGGGVLVGEIKAGETKAVSLNLRAEKDRVGEVSGKMTVAYEDEYGEKFVTEEKVESVIQEKPPVTGEAEKEVKKNGLWWLFTLLGAAAGAGAFGSAAAGTRARRQRKKDEETL